MKYINIDIETYSSNDLTKCGVHKYCEADDFEILLFGYAVDGGEVKVIDLANGEKIPQYILNSLTDKKITKWAFNAQFERICLSKYLNSYLEPESWKCTMVWCATLGLPLSLEGVGKVLGLEKQKLIEGKELIRFFCVHKKNKEGHLYRNNPSDAPLKWELFKAYNKRDVETELSIQRKIKNFPVRKQEWINYHLDQRINDRGIMLDMDFVKRAIQCDEKYKETRLVIAKNITGLENPNSPQQLKEWLLEQGIVAESLSKQSVYDLIEQSDGEVQSALSLRQELSKSSVKKYTAMQNAVCKDNRARGLIQFYGANRTGRYSGRIIQTQNLPQNHLPDLSTARELVRNGCFEEVEMLYDSSSLVLSELIRTAFIPKKGHDFFVADFSAIEARVIAWLADEKWRNKVFRTGGDIYCASASQMFNVKVVKNGENGHLRQKGKIAELALGYGGSVGALKAMGALNMGLNESDLQPLVTAWRNSNSNITKLWWEVDKAVKKAVREKTTSQTYGVNFSYKSGMLFITLPSGRNLVYIKPTIGINKFGGECVTYEGVGAQKKWTSLESYGPKFVENIVQAIARDILAEAMIRLENDGYRIVMHVHDEAVIEAPSNSSLEDICTIMGQTPLWAKDLLLRADGYTCDFYRKD